MVWQVPMKGVGSGYVVGREWCVVGSGACRRPARAGLAGGRGQLLTGRQLLGCSLAAAAAAVATVAAPEAACAGRETPRLGLKEFLRAARDEAAVAGGLVAGAPYVLHRCMALLLSPPLSCQLPPPSFCESLVCVASS
eukprot:COSAG02_NODE_840_length_16627_cov_11.279828_9_plen_138_part_00